ncbi:hypothetical protein BE221DRAFT_62951, partial [Ostreococcus tauri]
AESEYAIPERAIYLGVVSERSFSAVIEEISRSMDLFVSSSSSSSSSARVKLSGALLDECGCTEECVLLDLNRNRILAARATLEVRNESAESTKRRLDDEHQATGARVREAVLRGTASKRAKALTTNAKWDSAFVPSCLLPPRLKSRSKILLRPRGEGNRVVAVNDDVRESQGERSRTADHLTVGIVLGAVARALELVLSLVPRDDATQVRAHRVQAEIREGTVRLDDQVRGVTLQTLGQRIVTRKVRLQPRRLLDVVAVSILRRLTSTATTGTVMGKIQAFNGQSTLPANADAGAADGFARER